MHSPEVIAELKKNQAAYNKVENQMEVDNWGKTVLLHDGEVAAVYNSDEDAYSIGCEKYGLGHFSLHRVGIRPMDLGFHAISFNLQG